ncbi:hypothetical protein K440DRAFT_646672 [Wilcoxina mikolae CBS 423.85]|nr:hypothetical protein K440DRAFT_646672 [Wilcoxina mikolae CBS 423.85]
MIKRQDRRLAEGKRTVFKFHGVSVSSERIERSRKRLLEYFPSPAESTPSGVEYMTPRSPISDFELEEPMPTAASLSHITVASPAATADSVPGSSSWARPESPNAKHWWTSFGGVPTSFVDQGTVTCFGGSYSTTIDLGSTRVVVPEYLDRYTRSEEDPDILLPDLTESDNFSAGRSSPLGSDCTDESSMTSVSTHAEMNAQWANEAVDIIAETMANSKLRPYLEIGLARGNKVFFVDKLKGLLKIYVKGLRTEVVTAMHMRACTILHRKYRSITPAISRHILAEGEPSTSHDNIEKLAAISLTRDEKIELLLGKEDSAGMVDGTDHDDDEYSDEEEEECDIGKLVIEDSEMPTSTEDKITVEENLKALDDAINQSDVSALSRAIAEHTEYTHAQDIRQSPLTGSLELASQEFVEYGQSDSTRREVSSSDGDHHDIFLTLTSDSIQPIGNILNPISSSKEGRITICSNSHENCRQDPKRQGNWGLGCPGVNDNIGVIHRLENPDMVENHFYPQNISSPGHNHTMVSSNMWPLRYETGQPLLNDLDRIQLFIERYAGMPILWWPMRQPKRPIPAICSRLSWDLDCGHTVSIDVPAPLARALRNQEIKSAPGLYPTVMSSTPGGTSNNAQLNAYASQTSNLSRSSVASSAISGACLPHTHQQGSISITAAGRTAQTPSVGGNSPEKYIFWCVDGSTNDKILHQICVESTMIPARRGKDFIKELLDSYKRLRGWRWWLSFTFFRQITDDEDLIGCVKERLEISDLDDPHYQYVPIDPKSLHIARVETTLAHQLCCGGGIWLSSHCKPSAIERLIAHLPTKATGKLERDAVYGLGLHARQGWAFYKIVITYTISQTPFFVFAAFWMFHHPGDLQNAFQPAQYALALVSALFLVADYLLK